MEKTLFSTPEVAEWLGVFHTTVRRWIEKGRIKGIRVGRNYKIPAEEVIRILDSHDIPLPEVVRRYRLKLKNKARGLPSHGGYDGSILQKLLIVEEIEDPAFVCRKASILGANQAFADLVGYSQADLIGLDIVEVIDEASQGRLVDFAQRRMEQPEKGPPDYVTYLKTDKNRKKQIKITTESLNHMKDVFLLIVKDA
jgi:excisionase family DNA binding protein/PAS domain S-box-containing protein